MLGLALTLASAAFSASAQIVCLPEDYKPAPGSLPTARLSTSGKVPIQSLKVPDDGTEEFDGDSGLITGPDVEPSSEAKILQAPPEAAQTPRRTGTQTDVLPKRIRVRLGNGRTAVARVHGNGDGDVHVMLPDGQLAIADRRAETDEPFQVSTREEMIADLLGGPFAGFEVVSTEHYLILHQASPDFAKQSAGVLEGLYRGLTQAFRKHAVEISEAEFPLVAVIFKTEREFRAFKRVDPEVQAYYEIYTNRIYFYETSERDEQAPEVAALRRPQTVAHEGTHQVLQNIGIQPRLASWPPWLIEGLAEYCATPLISKKGTTWAGLGYVNSLHVATIRDLDDPLSGQVPRATRPAHIGRPRGMPLVEYLVTREDLTPTDYALAWAMTHYLAQKRGDAFVAYLKQMSTMPPFTKQTPAQRLTSFRAAFGPDLARLDREIGGHVVKLKVTHHLPFYAVCFEQRFESGLVKREAIVSQSPSMIRQWLETITSPYGEEPLWVPSPYPTRTPALLVAEEWVAGY